MEGGALGSDCEREGEVCNHLIQTYTWGISLLDLTVSFEPYLVSISLPLVWRKVQKLDSPCLQASATKASPVRLVRRRSFFFFFLRQTVFQILHWRRGERIRWL